jgi:oligopeptide transport system substrate-binding protein
MYLPVELRQSIGLPTAFALLSITLLIGCDKTSRVESGNASGILHYAIGGEPQTLDPHVASADQDYLLISGLLEGLVTMSARKNEILPAVASHWIFDDDGMGATFFLKQNARWSNGDPVTAHDFVFAWQRAVNPRMGNQLAETLFPLKNAERIYRGDIKDLSQLGALVIDDLTLRMNLEYPMPPDLLLLNLSHSSAVPLHQKTLHAHGGASERYSGWAKPGNYVANGPYMLAEWRMQRDVELVANPYYWDAQSVTLDSIKFYPIDSVNAQEKLFRSGQIHITSGLPPNKAVIYSASENSPLVNQPTSRTSYIAVNLNRPPLDDRRIRLALALAIDRKALVRAVYEDTATPLGRYLPAGVKGYQPPDISISFDPERARLLLEEAGYTNGQGFPEIEILVASGQAGRAIATALQQMWRDVLNISVSAYTQEFQVYLNSLVGGEFDLVYASWNGGLVPAGFLDRWISGSLTNDSRFSHPEYDKLITERSRSTSDVNELMGVYRQAEEILLTELPIIPLLQSHATYLKQPSVRGMLPNTLNVIEMKNLSLADLPVWHQRGR